MKKRIIIDSNSLILIVLGLMDPSLINDHKTTSIYDESDFTNLMSVIDDFESVIVLPNIWTEVDNLLNRFGGQYKDFYVKQFTTLARQTTERYLETSIVEISPAFYDLGLTDTLILECAKECGLLISGDSTLCDYARGLGISVYDIKAIKNQSYR